MPQPVPGVVVSSLCEQGCTQRAGVRVNPCTLFAGQCVTEAVQEPDLASSHGSATGHVACPEPVSSSVR